MMKDKKHSAMHVTRKNVKNQFEGYIRISKESISDHSNWAHTEILSAWEFSVMQIFLFYFKLAVLKEGNQPSQKIARHCYCSIFCF